MTSVMTTSAQLALASHAWNSRRATKRLLGPCTCCKALNSAAATQQPNCAMERSTTSTVERRAMLRRGVSLQIRQTYKAWTMDAVVQSDRSCSALSRLRYHCLRSFCYKHGHAPKSMLPHVCGAKLGSWPHILTCVTYVVQVRNALCPTPVVRRKHRPGSALAEHVASATRARSVTATRSLHSPLPPPFSAHVDATSRMRRRRTVQRTTMRSFVKRLK